MKTLGVDLASQKEGTSLAAVQWSGGRATLEHLACCITDAEILDRAADAEAIGIDAPFGWPVAFIDMVTGNESVGPWSDTRRDELRFRRTDRYVKENVIPRRWPLSVSSDLIAIPAMRCRGLLEALRVADRSGDGRVFEVYPRAGLSRWGLLGSGYKGRAKAMERSALWSALRTRAPWLDVPSQHADLASSSDDAFDAVVCALLARAAACGLVDTIPDVDREAARQEGWIALPLGGSLDQLPTV